MQLTYCIGNPHAEAENGELQGFVFTCPNCRTPASYQPREAIAVEIDKKTFENFRRAIEKKVDEQEMLRGVALTKQCKSTALPNKPIDEGAFNNMLKDIKECDNYDEFLKRIEK